MLLVLLVVDPPPADLTDEEKKIINIFGGNNPFFSGEQGGFDSLMLPNTAVTYLDLSSDDVLSPPAQQQSPKIRYEALMPVPPLERSMSSSSGLNLKRKFQDWDRVNDSVTKEQITINVLKAQLSKNLAAKEKYDVEVELIKDLRAAAQAKLAYYSFLSTKVQLETALLGNNSNVRIVNSDTKIGENV
uniref:TolC family protein n=1 Tax=Romanomermis culicivorax TaxID=13658 RepID=A0A915K8I3_ROMCU